MLYDDNNRDKPSAWRLELNQSVLPQAERRSNLLKNTQKKDLELLWDQILDVTEGFFSLSTLCSVFYQVYIETGIFTWLLT